MKPFRTIASLFVLGSLCALLGVACQSHMSMPAPALPTSLVVHTIDITNCRPTPQTLNATHGDAVAWNNHGTVTATLTFTSWPFTGAATPITVPAGGTSAQFILAPHKDSFSYGLSCPGALPDSVIGPGVIVDD
jgi:hypothetical protein